MKRHRYVILYIFLACYGEMTVLSHAQKNGGGSFGVIDSPMKVILSAEALKHASAVGKIDPYIKKYWADFLRKREGIGTVDEPVGPDNGAWNFRREKDEFSGNDVLYAERKFAVKGGAINVQFQCDTRRRQLRFKAVDVSDIVSNIGVSANDWHVIDLNIMYIPAPYGYEDGHIFSLRPRIANRTIDFVGFGPNNWGVSLCREGGGAGLAFNSPFCQQHNLKLPPDLISLADRGGADLGKYKDRALVPERWSNFREIRFKLGANWGNPAVASPVSMTYVFSVRPNLDPLKGLLSACERNEDRCVEVEGSEKYRKCMSDMSREFQNHE